MALSLPGGPNSSSNGSLSSGGGGGDEESPDDNKGKGKDLDKMRDFETLE
jgi:mitofusin 2